MVETEVEVQAPDVSFVSPEDALIIPEPATSEASYNQQARSESPLQPVSMKIFIILVSICLVSSPGPFPVFQCFSTCNIKKLGGGHVDGAINVGEEKKKLA